jgi:hypothetical protein
VPQPVQADRLPRVGGRVAWDPVVVCGGAPGVQPRTVHRDAGDLGEHSAHAVQRHRATGERDRGARPRSQPHLTPRDLVAGRCPRLVRSEHGAHRQPRLGVAGRLGREIELDALARHHPWHVQLPRLDLDAVLLDGPPESQVSEVEHLVQVGDAQAPVRGAGDPHRLDHLGELAQPR